MANNQYSPYYDVNAIYNYKGQYDKAKTSGNSQLAQEIANMAQQNYTNLRDNGRDDVAKSLSDTGYAGAKAIRDKYAMTGKVAIRPYLYNSKLKTKYGLSDADIDKALSFNETTGEVSLGGMNLGSPYSNVDGTTYWDSTVLDKAIDNYITHSGITPSKTELINQNNAGVLEKTNALYDLQMSDYKDMSQKFGELYDKAMYENPFETPTGQSIMNEYKLKGAQESDNAKASGGASNSGNIDSYAAANALRQQAAMTAKGQQMAIAAQTEAINNVRGVLGEMDGHQQNSYAGMQNTIAFQQLEGSRLFEEQQTEKLNDHNINYDIAEMTGYVPLEWDIQNNRYFTNGTLTNPNLDYGLIIEDIDKKLETETDEVKREELLKQKNEAALARSYKTSPSNYGGKYSQYAGNYDLSGYSRNKTVPAMQSEREYAVNMGMLGNEAYNNFIETQLKSEQEAMNILESYVKNGVPPTKYMLDAAGYGNYTPESFMQEYIKNKGLITKASKVSTGSAPKSDDKDKLSDSAKRGIYDYIKGPNYDPEGLRAWLSSYDWDKYDASDVYSYIYNNFGKDKEVMNVVYEYFDIPNPDKVTTAAKTIADTINNENAEDSEEFIANPPIKASENGYTVGDNFAQTVIHMVYNDKSLTDTEAWEVLALFGISEEQVREYEENKNYEK